MIKYTDSNVFNTKAQTIVNTINCDGFMGKGLAYEFGLRYPSLLNDYKKKCENKEVNVGKIYYYVSNNEVIVNFPTKNHYKYPSKLEWIEDGLKDFVNTYKNYNITSIAFPLLGCSNGGLDKSIVLSLMKKHLGNLDIDVYICSSSKKECEGKELEMLTNFKNTNIYELSRHIKLSSKQIIVLEENQKNIVRFFQISKLDSIGATTYENIFKYFYNKTANSKQLTLF